MAFQLAASIQQLFGSETRAKVLGLLASSSEPKTGYELSKALEANVSKVYGVLRKLEGSGFLGVVVDRSGYKRFALTDEDLRSFLLKKVRITTEDDWFAPAAVESRKRLIERASQVELGIPAVRRGEGSPDMSEFVRPPEKDAALRGINARDAKNARTARNAGTPSRRTRR